MSQIYGVKDGRRVPVDLVLAVKAKRALTALVSSLIKPPKGKRVSLDMFELDEENYKGSFTFSLIDEPEDFREEDEL